MIRQRLVFYARVSKDRFLTFYKTISYSIFVSFLPFMVLNKSAKSAQSVVSVFFAKQTQFPAGSISTNSFPKKDFCLLPPACCLNKQTQFKPKQTQNCHPGPRAGTNPIPKNPRNPWFQFFSQNEPNSQPAQNSLTRFLKKTSAFCPLPAASITNPIQSRFKPNANPIPRNKRPLVSPTSLQLSIFRRK
jgi:hypothetical protein